MIEQPNAPREERWILATTDVEGFAQASKLHPDSQTFRLLEELYELIGSIAEAVGGRVVNFMGDASLIAFPPESPEAAISSLQMLQMQSAPIFQQLGCRMRIRLHLGTVACGLLGTMSEKRYAVVGQAVNELFKMSNSGFEISPALQELLEQGNP